jgi:hypothetical protein
MRLIAGPAAGDRLARSRREVGRLPFSEFNELFRPASALSMMDD